MNHDLTVGKPGTVLRKYCLPLFGSILFQQLYNLADSLVAGKFVGEEALAAVGNSYEITLVFLAFAFGCNVGCSVTAARLFGGGKTRDLKTAVSTTFLATGVLCAVLMLFGFLFGENLLSLLHTPKEILTPSLRYLNVYLLGLPFLFFYNVSNGIFSALGDSKTPFLFLACSSLANIAADVLFTTVLRPLFPYGVDGVAWATFLCQGASCLPAVFFVLKRLRTVSDEKAPLFSLKLLKEIGAIAVPGTLQQGLISVGNLVLQGVINTFGTGVIAGYAAGVKLNNLVITSFTTLGNGISAFTAQNIGAMKYGRIREGFKIGLRIVWCLSLPIAVLYFFFGSRLVSFFLEEPSADALQTGVLYLRILAPFYFVVSAKLTADGVLRGAGKMTLFIISTFTDLITRVVLAVLLSSTFLESLGIWLSWPIGWVLGTALSVLFYLRFRKSFPSGEPGS